MSPNSRTCEAEVSVHKRIADSMSRGLHQATQPLSVLQGTLELALLSARTVEDFKHAIEQSLEELQRVTDSFEHLRTLAQLQQPAPDITTFAASSMVEAVLASLQAHFASVGVEFVLQLKLDDRKDSGEGRIRMSRSRVSAALKMALSEMLLTLPRGSRLFVLIEAVESDLLIRVDAVGPGQQEVQRTETPRGLMTPCQELARAMTASAGGELTFCPHSSGLLIRLPKMSLSSMHGEAEEQQREGAHV